MEPWKDDELKQLFAQQKHQETRHTPDFEQMWETTISESQTPKKRYWRFSMVAAGFLLMLNVGIWQLTNKNKPNKDVSALIEWQSPTNTLLPANIKNTQIAKTKDAQTQTTSQSSMRISEWQSPTDMLMPQSFSMTQ